ncbi:MULTISPECIES: effector-associated domain 2-containing protein [Streptomyces]|uniref:effector-associated domain 2-containing protein n=1 Tax=Streptomyces TaxID=1883 RepID=UPI000D3B7E42|nr:MULTISPECIES: trypsin-like peptidase domain-containing protein [Streptomyces]
MRFVRWFIRWGGPGTAPRGGRDRGVVKGDTAGAAALGRVRVLSPQGVVRGAGILVMPGTVLTCAHVVAAALAPGRAGPEAPPHPVLVDAPAHPDVPAGEAVVVEGGWSPGPLAGGSGSDLAVLRTEWSPSEDVPPARLGPCGEPDRREVGMYGHPVSAPHGLWSTARLVGRGGPHPDWIQLEGLGPTGAVVGHGFSGAGVWDPAARRVIGMVTAAYTDQQAKVAWMLPLEAAAGTWPDLASAMAAPASNAALSPGRWRPAQPSDRDQFALADALLNIPPVEEDHGAALRGLLPATIRRAVRTHARPRLQLFFLVQACAEHPGGRRALIEALRLLDDESRAAKAALELFEERWPSPPGSEAS